ncbi:MAG: type 1 glutamine amidotransferase domain-containing protein [Rothia sp. (in: high G+C Gram-positive bacteria)]|nr:type 1 glutamine amidotransferase domain-containing protein [Rothia sp. (in: high G+C Gram-positive bacteria)]
MADLSNKKALILASQGVEQIELTSPHDALQDAGAEVILAAPEGKEFQAMEGDWDKADTFTPDLDLADVNTEDYDVLILPGGTLNADSMRIDSHAGAIVTKFFEAEKPVAAICHAPWLLINANRVKNRKMTSFTSVKDDLLNAGAQWVDEEVVVDGNLITSRNPGDLEAFNKAIIEKLS